MEESEETLPSDFAVVPAAGSAAPPPVRNLPPGPRGRRMAWLCLDSCKYGFRPFDVRRNCSSSFWRATRRFKMRWNCFALTYSGDSSAAAPTISGEG